MSILATLASTLFPALITPVADGVRGAIARYTGGEGAKPQNVTEAIKLMEANTDRLRALAELDKPSGNASQWVTNLRESSRYIAAGAVIANGIGQAAWGTDPVSVGLSIDMAASAFFFLFGDRVYVNLKKAAR